MAILGCSSSCLGFFSFIFFWLSTARDGFPKRVLWSTPIGSNKKWPEQRCPTVPGQFRAGEPGLATPPLCFCLPDLFCCLFLTDFHPRINRHSVESQREPLPWRRNFGSFVERHSSFKSPPVSVPRSPPSLSPRPGGSWFVNELNVFPEGCFWAFRTLLGQPDPRTDAPEVIAALSLPRAKHFSLSYFLMVFEMFSGGGRHSRPLGRSWTALLGPWPPVQHLLEIPKKDPETEIWVLASVSWGIGSNLI